MKKLGLFLSAAAVVFLSGQNAQAVTLEGLLVGVAGQNPHIVVVTENAGAEAFVDGMAREGINFLGDPALSAEQREQKFRALLERSYDMQTIGKFALGNYWKSATPAQQSEYQKLFKEMVIAVYSKRFGDYKGEALVVETSRPEGKYDVLVTSKIVPPSGEKIQVDWRVRNKGGVYKVVDVVVEGVSMAVTQRNDFSSVIQRGGGNIEVLLDHLRKR